MTWRNVFSDERGNWSAARVFFMLWTAIVVWASWYRPAEAFWPVAATVMLGLLSWAAGPRIAQYLAPQVGAAAQATAAAVRDMVQKRRNVADGIEEPPK